VTAGGNEGEEGAKRKREQFQKKAVNAVATGNLLTGQARNKRH